MPSFSKSLLGVSRALASSPGPWPSGGGGGAGTGGRAPQGCHTGRGGVLQGCHVEDRGALQGCRGWWRGVPEDWPGTRTVPEGHPRPSQPEDCYEGENCSWNHPLSWIGRLPSLAGYQLKVTLKVNFMHLIFFTQCLLMSRRLPSGALCRGRGIPGTRLPLISKRFSKLLCSRVGTLIVRVCIGGTARMCFQT